jgi:ATP-dependent DNA ligase
MVLDAPARVEPIEKRLEFVRQLQMPRNWEIVDTVTCKNSEHLQSYLQESIRNGGIGVLLRTASSYYVVFEKPAVMLVEVKFSTLLYCNVCRMW